MVQNDCCALRCGQTGKTLTPFREVHVRCRLSGGVALWSTRSSTSDVTGWRFAVRSRLRHRLRAIVHTHGRS